jgi:DNA replication protein DnaC
MDDSLKLLKSQLIELKLKHLAGKLDDMMLEAGSSDKSYSQIIQEFLAVEIRQRRSLSIGKRLRYAGFPSFDKPLDLDAYDFAKRRGVSKRQIIELTSNFIWIDKAYNILFFGGSGLGKSYLACYIGYKAIEAGYNVIFISMHNLARLIKTENILSRSKTRMKRLLNCDLLIIDEVGNAVLDRLEGNRMFQLISDFYQQTSLIVTANRGFEDWSQSLGDNVVTSAVMDRLLHKCEIFNLEGDSWRLEDQQSILKNLFKDR